MPEGQAFFCLARTIDPAGRLSRSGGLPHRIGQLSIGLGCPIQYARELVYSDGLNLDDPQIVTPIGVSCRTCPRDDCSDRAMPSLNQRLEIDENRRGPSTYVRPTALRTLRVTGLPPGFSTSGDVGLDRRYRWAKASLEAGESPEACEILRQTRRRGPRLGSGLEASRRCSRGERRARGGACRL